MPFRDSYRKQVALLIRVVPLVAKEDCFALKGGTAINLFDRDMPRLSVDIDLTYVPVASRAESLKAIDAAMRRSAARVKEQIPGAQVTMSMTEGAVNKLIVREGGVQIKIEVTPVLRGCVFEPETRTVTEKVEEEFGFAEMPVGDTVLRTLRPRPMSQHVARNRREQPSPPMTARGSRVPSPLARACMRGRGLKPLVLKA